MIVEKEYTSSNKKDKTMQLFDGSTCPMGERMDPHIRLFISGSQLESLTAPKYKYKKQIHIVKKCRNSHTIIVTNKVQIHTQILVNYKDTFPNTQLESLTSPKYPLRGHSYMIYCARVCSKVVKTEW